ncbi:hypothetical protein Tco_0020954 [Tanacetum coccineum]
MSLSEYYHECNALWRQFDALIDLPGCSCAAPPKVKEHGQLLRSAFATLFRNESLWNSGSSSKFVKTGPSAFAARPSNGNNWNSNKNGYPPWFKRNNSGQSNYNSATSNDIKTDHSKSAPNTLTIDQYQILMVILSDTSNTSKTHASVAGFNSKVPDRDRDW